MSFLVPALVLSTLPVGHTSRQHHSGGISLHGIGATFPVEVYDSWGPAFEFYREEYVSMDMDYKDSGSWMGKTSLKTDPIGEMYHFGGSDALMSDIEYIMNPNLQMVPVVAGAVMLGYNLPGVRSLVLSRSHLVGIYNGTYRWWNDTALQELNPNATLPHKRIKVVARSDYSGTTEIFTNALSAFDNNWCDHPGTFADGLNPNGINHSKWDMNIVKNYGQTSRGMVGILFSVRYAIGYLSVAEAKVANLTYARLINYAGQEVGIDPQATFRVVQEDACESFGIRLTAPLVDSHLPDAYPILGFSYFIIRLHGLVNCDSATQLVRYLEWLDNDEMAQSMASEVGMTQLPNCVGDRVREILKLMTCSEDLVNVYELVEEQRAKEDLVSDTWRLPVYIGVPLSCTVLFTLVGYIVYQQVMLNKAVMADDWKIPPKEIKVHWDRDRGWVGSKRTLNMQLGSTMSTAFSLGSDVSVNIRGWSSCIKMVGSWHHRKVCLRHFDGFNPDAWKGLAKTLIQLKYKISHANVVRFYGVTFFGELSYLVADHAEKGSLRDVLQHTKYTIDDNFKYAMAWDVASGMEFLHGNNIVHGNLNSDCCVLDGQWNIKISNWELDYLTNNQKKRAKQNSLTTTLNNVTDAQPENPNAIARRLLWLSPEVLQKIIKVPDKPSDVYSFSMVLVEIFTREDPYSEYIESGRLQPVEIVEQLKMTYIRPDIKELVPEEVYHIISSSWDDKPGVRPGFHQILKFLDSAWPTHRTVLESMMTTLEEYAGQLESMVEDRTSELAAVNNNLEDLLLQMLPKSVASSLQNGKPVEPEQFDSVTIFFSHISGFNELTASSSPLDIVNLLNNLYISFDRVIEKLDVYKVETIGDSYMCISGLPVRNGIKHAGHIADMALRLMKMAKRFAIPNKPGEPLLLRAGIHSGYVVAGVVGMKTPRYCLFGDTVNTASRMETTSLPMHIQVSMATHKLLCQLGHYVMELRGQVEVKGKGNMTTYFLQAKEKSTEKPQKSV